MRRLSNPRGIFGPNLPRQLTYAGGTTLRAMVSLKEKHADFIGLVSHFQSTATDCDGGSVTLETKDNLAVINISNPRRKNSFSGEMMLQFVDIVDELTMKNCKTPKISCLIMRSKGCNVFCAGASFQLVKSVINNPARGLLMAKFMTDCLNKLRRSGLVSVSFINGPALGGGAELSTFSDFRIMTNVPSTRVQFVHANLGASPGWGGARSNTLGNCIIFI